MPKVPTCWLEPAEEQRRRGHVVSSADLSAHLYEGQQQLRRQGQPVPAPLIGVDVSGEAAKAVCRR